MVKESFTDNIDEIIRKSRETTLHTVADYIPTYNPLVCTETVYVVEEYVTVKK